MRLKLSLGAVIALLILAVAATSAMAETGTNERFPIELTFPNPCTGEGVYFNGMQHLVFRVTYDYGGGMHTGVHANIEGKGTSASGVKYQLHGEHNGEVYYPIIDSRTWQTLTDDYTLLNVSQGSADNFVIHFLTHFTVNSNGEPTASVDYRTSECRGSMP